MCSNIDDGSEGVILMEKAERIVITKWCKKCAEKTEAKIVLRKKDAYCKSCFLSSVNHKFRACLGKSKMIRPGDKVLVGFSGNDASVAILHLMKTGLEDNSHKKLMFQPFVIFIDETRTLELSEEERNNIIEKVKEVFTMYNYPSYIVPLELSLQTEEEIDVYLAGDTSCVDFSSLQELLSSFKDSTSKVDLLNKLRNIALVQAAKSLGCNKAFTAETADDLAVKLMTNVSLGRGAQLPFDIGFSDDRTQSVKVIRPMRDMSKKELVFYNVFHGLKSVQIPSMLTMIDAHSNIQRLTECFLIDLQEGFPSTLSTVFRVADKLTTSANDERTCPICNSPFDAADIPPSSSQSATQFSQMLSLTEMSKFDSLNLVGDAKVSGCCGGGDSATTSNMCCGGGSCSNQIEDKLLPLLCYGCNLIFRNADMKIFPDIIIKHLKEKSQRSQMKKEIEKFLL